MTVTKDEILAMAERLEMAGNWFKLWPNAAMWGDAPSMDNSPFKAAAMLRKLAEERGKPQLVEVRLPPLSIEED